MPDESLDALAKRAIDGDRESLNDLVRALQIPVYGISVRMLWNRADAEDATQEILVRVVTRLSQFDFRSALKTWVYRVAVNHLLDMGPEAAEALDVTPDLFRKRLQRARSDVASFTRAYCGLVSDSAACACHRRIPAALASGRVREDQLDFATESSSFSEARAAVRRLDDARQALAVHRLSEPRASSIDFAHRLVDGF
jgi:RNA polymerase sigma factor (sigma-70 family)